MARWYVARAGGRLDRAAAAPTLREALEKLEATADEHVVWGVVEADRESTARVMDPELWYATC